MMRWYILWYAFFCWYIYIYSRFVDCFYNIFNVQRDSCVFWDSSNLQTEASCSTEIQRNGQASHFEFEGKGRFISPWHVEIHHEELLRGRWWQGSQLPTELALGAGVNSASLKQYKEASVSVKRLERWPRRKSPRNLLPRRSPWKPAAKKHGAKKASNPRARPRISPR